MVGLALWLTLVVEDVEDPCRPVDPIGRGAGGLAESRAVGEGRRADSLRSLETACAARLKGCEAHADSMNAAATAADAVMVTTRRAEVI